MLSWWGVCPSVPHLGYATANQPMEILQIKGAISYSGKTKQYCRTIQGSWYNKYPWITVCTGRYKIFCRVCCLAKQQKLLSPSVFKTSPFIAEGFGSWNNRTDDLDLLEIAKQFIHANSRRSNYFGKI